MQPRWNFSELEIVGYANVLRKTMLPSIVPPVFRFKAEPDRVFLPPYLYNSGLLCNATEVSQAESAEMQRNGQITLFDSAIPACIGFELWIDQSFQHHYEPVEEVGRQLAGIADDGILRAQAALLTGDLETAERWSGVAISANDRRVEPLAIKAAIRRMQGNKTGEELMARLAARVIGERQFFVLVDYYAEGTSGNGPAGTVPRDVRRRPMFEMAMAGAA